MRQKLALSKIRFASRQIFEWSLRPIRFNELPASSCRNGNLVLSISGDPVKGIDKLRITLCRESQRPALGVKFDN